MARRRVKNSSSKPDDPLLLLEPPVVQPRGIKEYALPCALFIFILFGGSMLAWFCSQQQQAIEDLTEALTTVQTRITKLQQQLGSGNAQLANVGGFEERLLALEESNAKAQRQAEVALAASEQIKSKDLQNKVWALQTEMNAKLAELQQNSISIASLNAIIKNKSDDVEAVKQSISTILSANTELGVSISGLTSSLSLTESHLGEQVSVVDGLKSQLEYQKREIESFTSNQEAIVTNVQELMELRQQMELQQVKRAQAFKEQLRSLHKKLENHQTSTETLHSQLSAQLKAVQTQMLREAQTEEVQNEVEEQADKADDEKEQTDITDYEKKGPKEDSESEHTEEKDLAVHPEARGEDKVLEEHGVSEENRGIEVQGAKEEEHIPEEQEANKSDDDVPTDKEAKQKRKVTGIKGAEVAENVNTEPEKKVKEEEELNEKHGVAEEEHQAIPQEVEDVENEEHDAEKIPTNSSEVSDITNQTEETDLTQTKKDEQTEETAAKETEMHTTSEKAQSSLEVTNVNANEIKEMENAVSSDQHTEKTEIEDNGAEDDDSKAAAEEKRTASDETDSGPNETIVETSEKQEGESAETDPVPVEELSEDSDRE